MSATTVRSARADDTAALCALFGRAFGKHVEPTAWRWKHTAHFAADRVSPTVWVAVDDRDRPISCYAGLPRRLALPGGRVAGAMIAVDGMTDPRARRRGVYARLLETAHRAWRDAGVACVLGLPGTMMASHVEALDWRLLHPLGWRLRPLRPEALLARRLGWPALARLRAPGRLYDRLADRALAGAEDVCVAVAERADGRFDGFEVDEVDRDRPERERAVAGLTRGRGWIEQRYVRCPHHAYELLTAADGGGARGYLAWRLDRSGSLPFGVVAEWRATDARPLRALLWAALVSMRRARAAAAVCLVAPGTADDAQLRRAGFRFGWGTFELRCVLLADDLPIDLLGDAARFPVAGGDFDVV